ncbi:MAG: rhamnulokinase [Vicinamibacteria bacterium]|jgi:rhamnulokinase|nr:rhamnulokinase [Vicinamibacteria bacterium]
MAERVYLAVDLGAESGRVVAGRWNGKTILPEEIHHFPNGPVQIADTLRWDVLRLWSEIQKGLALAVKIHGKNIVSVGADTWGVDYVLLNKTNEMLGQPYHYRDARTRGMLNTVFRKVPRPEIFAQTGLQFMERNTLYQLMALQKSAPELLDAADCLLLMPDFLHFCLCGSRVVEFTNGSTTQCLHPVKRTWASGLLRKMGLPTKIFPKIVAPGTTLGKLRASVAEATGLAAIPVVAPPTHDTAAAVAGVPTQHTGRANWAYLSSGTWSLMGVEVKQAALSKETLDWNLTNEGGLDGTYRLLKNIMGLWLVRQCKRAFDARGRFYEYATLTELARQAPPLRSIVNPDDESFLNPPDMPLAIQDFCRKTHQPVPETEGAIVRCALESLALNYRQVLGWLEELTNERIEIIHVVGGGSKNSLLNQMTADACGRPVVAGPVEATALGNLLVQARASGEMKTLADIRAAIRASIDVERFEPAGNGNWHAAAGRFVELQTPLLVGHKAPLR